MNNFENDEIWRQNNSLQLNMDEQDKKERTVGYTAIVIQVDNRRRSFSSRFLRAIFTASPVFSTFRLHAAER